MPETVVIKAGDEVVEAQLNDGTTARAKRIRLHRNNLVDASGQIRQIGFVAASQFGRQESVVADLIEREPDLLEVHISFEQVCPLITFSSDKSKFKNLIVDRKPDLLYIQRMMTEWIRLSELLWLLFACCGRPRIPSDCVGSCVFIGPSHKKIKFFPFSCRSKLEGVLLRFQG